MKKLLAGFLLSTVISTTAYACIDDSGERGHKRHDPIKKMEKVLDLTEEQKTQLQELKEEMKQERKVGREKMKERMADILTAEQVEKLESMKEKRKSNRQHRSHGNAES